MTEDNQALHILIGVCLFLIICTIMTQIILNQDAFRTEKESRAYFNLKDYYLACSLHNTRDFKINETTNETRYFVRCDFYSRIFDIDAIKEITDRTELLGLHNYCTENSLCGAFEKCIERLPPELKEIQILYPKGYEKECVK